MGPLEVGVVAALVGVVGGGLAGFLVARLQRTWDLDARRIEDRKARLRAAADVVIKFMDAADAAQASPGLSRPIRWPLDQLSRGDQYAVSSVLRLFPDVTTWASFFYPANYLTSGEAGLGVLRPQEWDPVIVFVGDRLARLTAALEDLGDKDLRNFADQPE